MLPSFPNGKKAHLDIPTLLCIGLLLALGLGILYSASGQNFKLVQNQVLHILISLVVLGIAAHIPPRYYYNLAPWVYAVSLSLLIGVLLFGTTSKGAQRWLTLGNFRFQPAELMKLALPLMLAYYLNNKPLPVRYYDLFICLLFILVPTLLVAKQPDLGTAILIMASGLLILYLAGISFKLILSAIAGGIILAPFLWLKLHDYQRQRIFTFLNPESDPLGNGYHIIQSKIALGSGGLLGKGWQNGTQSQLDFLPEQTTDFIFGVLGEEFGFRGIIMLFLLYLCLIARGLYIGLKAQDTFSRLLAGSLILVFFVYIAVNVGMVSGLLPVVGIPLPLVSYGGTSLVTLMASFGIILSIHKHRKKSNP